MKMNENKRIIYVIKVTIAMYKRGAATGSIP